MNDDILSMRDTFGTFADAERILLKCISAMEKAKSIDDLNLSDSERLHFGSMWRTCREFLAEHDRLI